MTEEILEQYGIDAEENVLNPAGKCDQLLQEFHRFDEGLGIAGKWAGGSVTGVCRGWGTSKVRTKLLLFYLRIFSIYR